MMKHEAMFRFWPSLWTSSWKLRADSLCLENRGQSWTKEPRSCLSLVLGFRSEEEELSCFILNTAAYDAGLPATDLAKSGTIEQTLRVRERKTFNSHSFSLSIIQLQPYNHENEKLQLQKLLMEVTWQWDTRLSDNTIYLMTHFSLVPLYRKYTNYIPISLSLISDLQL